jgi:serine protease AprX
MAESRTRGERQERLPIKLILPNQGKERAVKGGGGAKVPFRKVDGAFRESLGNQVEAIQANSRTQVRRAGAVPVRVKLLGKASAKSHRPDALFSEETCPIIGAGSLGELFVKATPEGLDQLAKTIARDSTKQMVQQLSTVEAIEPITPAFRRGGQSPLDLLRKSPRGRKGFVTRVRLFDYGSDNQSKLVEDFARACAEQKLRVSSEGYSARSFVYGVECSSDEDVDCLSRVVGVRAIARMPLMRTIRPRMLNVKPLPTGLPTPDQVEGDVPTVVVVDTGVSTRIAPLAGWIVGQQSDVSPQYQNVTHGTFVAGLICWGTYLNPNLGGLNAAPCAIFDLQVLPNDDPGFGETLALMEQEFLQSLETALRAHANQYKVWNLSLGSDEVCSLDQFSPLAEQLDELQERYQVSFVISAGNYETPPLLDYPRSGSELEAGRITSPADSVLGITVGSVSHINYAKDGPKEHQPSPFSRHGAGPNHVIKPDLVHYGGSCSMSLSHEAGVRSVSEAGSAEDIGTSFATPLVSRALAQIYHQITPTPSPVLARALLTHHARDPRNGGRVPDGEENCFGFGLPAPPPYCLECTPHSATLVFEDHLRSGYYLEWENFPYPPSLFRNGRYFGDVSMTVAFAPSRGGKWGTEYCETHIDAHFGVYYDRKSKKSGKTTETFRGLVPPEHKNPGQLYEAYQIERLRKWAPVRTYHGDLGESGERGKRWRLKVQLLTRHGVSNDTRSPQPFSLIVTIADPKKTAPVYDEVSQLLRTKYQAANLAVRTPARIRAGSEPPPRGR